jgi:hypothetical protein
MSKKLTIDADKAADILESLKECESYLTERISDLHEVKGGMQARHSYIFYRQYVYRAWIDLRDNLKELPVK